MGILKLADFGIACYAGAPTAAAPGADLAGTALYMPPEVATCKKGDDYDERKHDVFSCSITLWFLWERVIPFQSQLDSPFELVADIIKGLRPSAEQQKPQPPGLAALLAQMWDAEPTRRPAMCEVVKELQRLDRESAAAGRSLMPKGGCEVRNPIVDGGL
jgi:serine/threonine protein kinase